MRILMLALPATLLLLSVANAIAEEGTLASVSIRIDMMDLDGNIHPLSRNDFRRARVFVFLSTTCPISNSYTPELNRIAVENADKIDFYGIVSEPHVKRDEAANHFAEYRIPFPVLFDASGMLANVFRPTHVPEAFLIDGQDKVQYRGAIDNAYEAIGRRRATVDRHYLEDSVVAIGKGTVPDTHFVVPVGCRMSASYIQTTSAGVTYTRDIAPILQTRCLVCHRTGEVAPFGLVSYAEALAHSEMIVEVTSQRIMPPWMPSDVVSDTSLGSPPKLLGDRRLSDLELSLLRRWKEAGCPEGDVADLPPSPRFVDGWRLGEPDLIVAMPKPFEVSADGPDRLQNFVLPINIAEDKLVAAIDFHPGNKRVVHHAVLFLDDKGQARTLDAATPELGYENFGGPGFLPSGSLGGWSVGNTPRKLPNDMGRYLKKGSDLVVQVHYHPTGKPESDQSEIGLYFIDKPVAQSLAESSKLVGSIWMANYEMDIPAGKSDYQRATAYRIPKEVQLVGIVPHMHLLGKSMTVTATFPSGEKKRLIDVPNWNYNWQDEYYLERPCTLPQGTVLAVAAMFDNSSDNPSNPSSPPMRVTWGEETTDEMLFCFFLLTAEKPADLIHVIFDNLSHDSRQTRAPK